MSNGTTRIALYLSLFSCYEWMGLKHHSSENITCVGFNGALTGTRGRTRFICPYVFVPCLSTLLSIDGYRFPLSQFKQLTRMSCHLMNEWGYHSKRKCFLDMDHQSCSQFGDFLWNSYHVAVTTLRVTESNPLKKLSKISKFSLPLVFRMTPGGGGGGQDPGY